jgi:hypothetical protein
MNLTDPNEGFVAYCDKEIEEFAAALLGPNHVKNTVSKVTMSNKCGLVEFEVEYCLDIESIFVRKYRTVTRGELKKLTAIMQERWDKVCTTP